MSQNSPRLNLPFIQPSQAQKHVTHNEALRHLDLVVQLSLIATDAVTPPATPAQGDIHALGAAPTGDWAGQGGKLAESGTLGHAADHQGDVPAADLVRVSLHGRRARRVVGVVDKLGAKAVTDHSAFARTESDLDAIVDRPR